MPGTPRHGAGIPGMPGTLGNQRGMPHGHFAVGGGGPVPQLGTPQPFAAGMPGMPQPFAAVAGMPGTPQPFAAAAAPFGTPFQPPPTPQAPSSFVDVLASFQQKLGRAPNAEELAALKDDHAAATAMGHISYATAHSNMLLATMTPGGRAMAMQPSPYQGGMPFHGAGMQFRRAAGGEYEYHTTSPSVSSPLAQRKSDANTPEPSKRSARKTSVKRKPPPPPPVELGIIHPVFAMMVRSRDHLNDVLAIGAPSTASWDFDLSKYVKVIHENNPGRDIYTVGYRDEERPNLLDDRSRTSVPFFAVHTLPAGSDAPKDLVIKDLELKTEKVQSVSASAFHWKQLYTFPTGETVHMLEFLGRSSRRSSLSQSTVSCGGYVYFSKPFNYTQNPGDSLDILLDGETYFFEEEVWDLSKVALKRAIKDSRFEKLRDCYRGAKKLELLGIMVPCLVDAFFEYYDDLKRETHEVAVTKALEKMIWQFKKSADTHEKTQEPSDAVHFKVYPENQELSEYLRGRGVEYISSYAGKAAAVYPSANG